MGPKSRNAKLASDGKPQKEVVGKHVQYIGVGNSWYVCPVCSRSFRRGFFWEDGQRNGCSQVCIKS